MGKKQVEQLFKSARNIYLVGIKGAAVAGLAQILKAKGYNVTGSDTHEIFFTDALLKRAKIKFHEGFDAKNIPDGVDLAISSNAYLISPQKGQTLNPEVLEIQKRGVPLLSYPEALSHLFNNSYGIAIAGTHGKTTTTAAVAFILKKAGLEPNALIGAVSANLKSNVLVGRRPTSLKASKGQNKNEIFVLEADEYKEAFLNYKPAIIVILNTDWDHPDYFKTEASYKAAFEKFKKNLKPGGKIFTPEDFTKVELGVKPSVIGEHNEYDLKAAAAAARYMGVKEAVIKKAVKEFKGTNRRLEVIGTFNGNIVIDDYGHNPQKVAAGLSALKKHYAGKEIIVVFQPHTYSRTEQFLKEFAKSLAIADRIYLLDIYASARETKSAISSDDLAKEIKRLGRNAINLATIPAAEKFFREHPPKNSVVVAMGAGDVGDLAHKLVFD